MSNDMLVVFATIAVAAVLFASNRVRLDVVAFGVVLVMMLSGILTPSQSLAGFGDSVVLLVAGLLVIGEMLDRTGVAQSIGAWIIRTGGSNETRLIVLIMLSAAALSSVMSSTAVVAILIPVVFKVAGNTGINASRLLMPMSFAAMISGMLTLIATPPNLVISSELDSTQGYDALGFFEFMPIGLVVLAVGILYVLLVGRRKLANPAENTDVPQKQSIQEVWSQFQLDERVDRLRLPSQSSMTGRTVGEIDIERRFNVRILSIEVTQKTGLPEIKPAEAEDELDAGDVLMVHGAPKDLAQFEQSERLEKVEENERDRQRILQEYGVGVILIHPDCRFIGKTLREADFRSRFGVHVMGIRRSKKPLANFANIKLAAADTLLVAGSWRRIAQLQNESHDFVLLDALLSIQQACPTARNRAIRFAAERFAAADTLLVAGSWRRIAQLQNESHDFVLLDMPAEYSEARPAHRKAPIAISILLAMVALSASGVVPVVTAVLTAAFAAVLTRCLTMEDAYRAISWSSLLLLAGMLPLAVALGETGGTEFLVNNVVAEIGSTGPYAMMTVLFFLTAGLSLFLSNTATAVIIAPVAIQSALAMGVSAYPFAITVLIASSAAFASPVASPVVTLVVEPGRYRFIDFVKVGGPLMLLTYVANMVLTPLMFPL